VQFVTTINTFAGSYPGLYRGEVCWRTLWIWGRRFWVSSHDCHHPRRWFAVCNSRTAGGLLKLLECRGRLTERERKGGMISHRANIWRLHSGSSPAISRFDTGGNILSWSHRQLTGHDRQKSDYRPHTDLTHFLLYHYFFICIIIASFFLIFLPCSHVSFLCKCHIVVSQFSPSSPSPTQQQRYALNVTRNGTQFSCFVCTNADRWGSIYKHENFHYVRLPICKQRNKGRVPYF